MNGYAGESYVHLYSGRRTELSIVWKVRSNDWTESSIDSVHGNRCKVGGGRLDFVDMKEAWEESSYLYSLNAPFVEGLYEDFQTDPESVSEGWRDYFEGMGNGATKEPVHSRIRELFRGQPSDTGDGSLPLGTTATTGHDTIDPAKQAGVNELINAYRLFGHLKCPIDPIHLRDKKHVESLDLENYGLTLDDLDTEFLTPTVSGSDKATLHQIVVLMEDTFADNIGIEYKHIADQEQRMWLQDRLESTRSEATYSSDVQKRVLERLTAAEGLERFLHTRYSGQKRFSLEGGESLIPLLDEVIQRAGTLDVKEIAIGMAHRGRLNVLVNIMGKLPRELFLQFEGRYEGPDNTTGDVKYHEGFSSNVRTPGGPVHLALAFNPSHLEIIDPVVEGTVRARQDRRGDFDRNEVLPILVHGDAAIAGQGVVYETFNLAKTRGFATGGTIHIVVNNQIGFTLSNPLDSRSTLYCTDIGKVVQAPILHVNGDDPEGVLYAAQLAVDFRLQFNTDFVIDLVCYRRHGHNEADEPAATQPVMYDKIRGHQTTRELYAAHLKEYNVVTQDDVDAMAADYRKDLEEGRNMALNFDPEFRYPFVSNWQPYIGGRWTAKAKTTITRAKLRELGELITRIPEDFKLHPRVSRIVEDRRKMIAGALPMDWGCAETLAYASLLDQGYPVRLTGQDSGRGTFFHRHAVLHNQRNGDCYVPLQNLKPSQPWFTIVDSILSEEAVLGFEFGYSTTDPNTLVIWEAQFGDFVNGAQVVIDQFISSSEQKWRRLCGLVMMLPHGWEGQGPEHSSARLERFIQLCAQENMQVCVPSTPAQMFHLLRRQMLRPFRKPLVIMSPKNLLRRKSTFTSIEDLTETGYRLVIGEIDALDNQKVDRLVICSGKVYWDILETRRERKKKNVAVMRLEQLYPFPKKSDETRTQQVPAYHGYRVGAGGTAQPGSLAIRAARHSRLHSKGAGADLRWSRSECGAGRW